MRIRLFSAFVASALLVPMASAQTSPAAPPAQFPATDDAALPASLPPVDPPLAADGSRYWVTNELLCWWMQGMELPALVSTSPVGTPTANAGVLGVPGNGTLYGPAIADANVRLGWRLTVGGWLTEDRRYALEAQFLTMSNTGSLFSAASGNGNTILARPLIDMVTGNAIAEPVSVPGIANGSIRVSTTTSGLFGAGVLVRETFYRSDDNCTTCRFPTDGACGSAGQTRLDSLLGFRYLRLSDHLEINDNVTALVALNGLPAGATRQRTDRFDSHNNFYGADLGFNGEYRYGAWSIGTLAKVAIGFNNASVDILGARSVNGVVAQGGLLAQPTNQGHFARTTVSAVPELNLKLGYNVTPNMQFSLSYSLLYWYHLARAANQVDTVLDPAFQALGAPIGGTPTSPAVFLQERSNWVQGISLGFEWQF